MPHIKVLCKIMPTHNDGPLHPRTPLQRVSDRSAGAAFSELCQGGLGGACNIQRDTDPASQTLHLLFVGRAQAAQLCNLGTIGTITELEEQRYDSLRCYYFACAALAFATGTGLVPYRRGISDFQRCLEILNGYPGWSLGNCTGLYRPDPRAHVNVRGHM